MEFRQFFVPLLCIQLLVFILAMFITKYAHLRFSAQLLLTFSHTESSAASSILPMKIFLKFSASCRTHWLAHRRQTRVKNRIPFIMPPFAQQPMLNSDGLRCSCKFSSALNFCLDPSVCTQKIAACLEENSDLLI